MIIDTIIEPARATHYRSGGWWQDRTLTDAFEAAVSRDPNKLALVAPGGVRLSYGELAARVEAVAGNLAAAGIRTGDVVSVQLPNWAEFVYVHLATTRLGAITNPLLPNYRTKELGHILSVARSAAVIIPAEFRGFDFRAMYEAMQPELPALKAVYVVGGPGRPDVLPFDSLLAPGARPPAALAPDGDAVSVMIFTSGTEAKPKGVMHSHNTLMYGTDMMARLLGLGAEDVIWAPSPLGHGTGFEWGMRLAIAIGGTLVLQDIWNADAALALVERERVSFTMTATAFVSMLLESQEAERRDLSSLRVYACAGAPIPQQLGEAANRRLRCSLIGMWGMTECFVATASPPSDPEAKRWHTDGKAMPGTEIAVFDETRSRQLPPGETGELATRGPHVCLGYFKDPDRNAETFARDGWLFSNDLAVMDADGYVRIVGRKKDIVNRGGLKVSAREVEELLQRHPAVLQVAVVGVPDDRLGEKACAFVVPRGNAAPRLPELVLYLDSHGIAKFKLPEHLVLLPELPITASGKIQKFMLRDGFAAGLYQRTT